MLFIIDQSHDRFVSSKGDLYVLIYPAAQRRPLFFSLIYDDDDDNDENDDNDDDDDCVGGDGDQLPVDDNFTDILPPFILQSTAEWERK